MPPGARGKERRVIFHRERKTLVSTTFREFVAGKTWARDGAGSLDGKNQRRPLVLETNFLVGGVDSRKTRERGAPVGKSGNDEARRETFRDLATSTTKIYIYRIVSLPFLHVSDVDRF